jgi:hypothetical protein
LRREITNDLASTQKKLSSVTLTAILAREENPPANIKEPIERLLLSPAD